MVESNIVQSTVSPNSIIILQQEEGYVQLSQKISSGAIDLWGCKVICILVGRFDVLDRSLPVEPKLQELQLVIGRVNPSFIIVLCTPLPRGGDDQQITRKLFCTGHMLRMFCQGKGRLEFAKIGANFTSPHGVRLEYFNKNNLNMHGWTVLEEAVKMKVQSASLRERYCQFLEAMQLMK